MTLDEFRQKTEGMPGGTSLVIMNTYDGEIHEISNVSTSRPSELMPVVFLESEVTRRETA